MARYRMEDGTVIDTARASAQWEEVRYFDGKNRRGAATGSSTEHERLYRSRRGRYYIEHWSQWAGSTPYVRWIDKRAAAAWLLANEAEIPDDLREAADEITE